MFPSFCAIQLAKRNDKEHFSYKNQLNEEVTKKHNDGCKTLLGLNDLEEKMRLLRLEQEEADRMERERLEFEEIEMQFLQALEMEKKRQQEEEEEQRKLKQEEYLRRLLGSVQIL
ncbi:stress response protein NST1 isoform X2 [Spinacia oleracea]|uniref:Stress response protein NST1 isoform X2 n=1 Tax=Spinacia oleracea TaxID=3562 RepID=A0ABM3R5W2_SPIOL|nr:stress response protein NST1-like isoform X2 [Spinacia oleracea]XP_056691010.1 stress response protein NST1-like isoform X2 [Spinacia oleracea]